jgi:hypothetical protein
MTRTVIEIEFTPWKKLVVHEVLEATNNQFFEDILRMSLAQNPNVEPRVNWAEGIAFLVYPMPDTKEIVEEKLKGIIHFTSFTFTRIDFRDAYPLRISNQDYRVILRRTEDNPVLVDLCRWAKEFNLTRPKRGKHSSSEAAQHNRKGLNHLHARHCDVKTNYDLL